MKLFQMLDISTQPLINHLSFGHWNLEQHNLLRLETIKNLQLILFKHMHMLQQKMKSLNSAECPLVIKFLISLDKFIASQVLQSFSRNKFLSSAEIWSSKD